VDISTTSFMLIIVLALAVVLLSGLPVGFTLGGLAVIGTLYLWGADGLLLFSNVAYAESISFILVAVPLFIFMANILKNAGLADDLYEMIYRWFGKVPGGLAAGTVIICAIFAAMAGLSSVATISMGLIAMPSMLNRGYDKKIVTGAISGGGTLGILIPPSIIMIVYGAFAEVSIGKLFMAGIIPGIMLMGIFCCYILIRCFIQPKLGPPITESFTLKQKLLSLRGVLLPFLLILLILGSMYTGAATPTEAAAIGAFGSIIASIIHGQFSLKKLKDSLMGTLGLTVMVMWILIGATAFTHILAYAGISDIIKDYILGLELSRWWTLIGIQLTFFILGMFLDPVGIIMLTTPIFIPIVTELGFDLIWFGILFTINMEMAYITPPFGFNLFIMKAVVPPEVNMSDIYHSIIPFVLLMILGLVIVMLWPQIVLFVPSLMV